MSGLKAIRRRITSVKNTKQITRAMKLVSAAKLRKAQDAALNGRSFADQLKLSLEAIQRELPNDFTHPLLDTSRPVRRRRVIIMAGERGLCGAYNTNVLKAVTAASRATDVEEEFVSVGRRAVSAAKKSGWNVLHSFEGLSEDAATWPVAELTGEFIADFLSGKIDEVVIHYTKFISAMTQVVESERLLPFRLPELDPAAAADAVQGATRFDPSPEAILEKLLPLLLRTRISQAGFESKASEHAARMTAMDSATNNADDLISRLRLFYNRARQSTITRELIDIVGGAEAIK